MGTEVKFKNHSLPEDVRVNKSKVKLTDLLMRLEEDKKRERKSNIALSIATVSAVAVLGVILSI
mgnify:CR=1 FL=1